MTMNQIYFVCNKRDMIPPKLLNFTEALMRSIEIYDGKLCIILNSIYSNCINKC